jgi:hypothetical protein
LRSGRTRGIDEKFFFHYPSYGDEKEEDEEESCFFVNERERGRERERERERERAADKKELCPVVDR